MKRSAPRLSVELVSAREADVDALVELRVLAMRASLEHIGRFDAKRARERFRLTFVAECTRHICVRGEKVGFVVVKHEPEALLLDHLYVHPEHQGQGIGAAVLLLRPPEPASGCRWPRRPNVGGLNRRAELTPSDH